MAGIVPTTNQEGLAKLLQQIAMMKLAPDADLEQLAAWEQQVITAARGPVDTPAKGSPVGGAQNLSPGATPGTAAPSPMEMALQQITGGGGASPAAMPNVPVRGLMASPAPPSPDELRRVLHVG